MRKALIYLMFLVICMACDFQSGFAQKTVSSSDSIAYKKNTLFLPAIGSTPETGFMFGGVVVHQFKFQNSGAETRSSSLFFSGIYTVKNQILVSFLPDILLPGEEWIVNGSYFVNYFPQSFWGVGASTKSDDEISIIYTEFNIEQSLLKKVRSSFFIGPYFRWNKITNTDFKDVDDDNLFVQDLRGASGSTSFGLGILARIDKRNSNMTPTKNHYVQLSILVNSSWLGTTHPYTSFLLDGRKYFDLNNDGHSVLAFQGITRMVSGKPSFLNLSVFGGDQINRGYYSGRYRDKNSVQFQTEFRQHVIGRFGFTLFAATGEVWNRFENLSFENNKWSAGAGLRINLNENDTTNLRIDFGIGKDMNGFYIQFGEAF